MYHPTTDRPKTQPAPVPAPDAGHCRLIVYHEDPGHGWCETTRSELQRLGIADKISTFSYTQGETVYLEEDCDAPKYLEALQAEGQKFRLCHRRVEFDHPIRCLQRFTAPVKR